MDRVLIGTAAGGLALYLFYLLQKGEDPKIIQRVTSTVPAPKMDPKIEPKMSGSGSSVVTAIANSGIDPQLDSRPTDLGGDAASTGTEQTPETQSTLDKTPVSEGWKALTQEQKEEVVNRSALFLQAFMES